MRIGIIGTGNMAGAFATGLAGKHDVWIGSRDPERGKQIAAELGAAGGGAYEDAVRDADVVILAVPWTAAEETAARLGDLSGVVVIDVMNPYVGGAVQPLEGSSTAEEVRRWLPGARVVKGWNHVFSANLERPRVDGMPTTVIVAGDDQAAKESVSRIARDLGFEAFDGGGLRAARSLELLHQAQAGLGLYPDTAMILRRV